MPISFIRSYLTKIQVHYGRKNEVLQSFPLAKFEQTRVPLDSVTHSEPSYSLPNCC